MKSEPFTMRPLVAATTLALLGAVPAVLMSGSARAQSTEGGAITLDPVQVSGELESAWGPDEGYLAPRSAVGTKTDVPLIETPQSATVVTREQLEDRGSDNLTEAVTYAPGVYIQNRAAQNSIDNIAIRIRGFSAQNAIFRDGTQVQAGLPYDSPTELYGLERVEILRGPASVLYGQGEPGGLVNLVTKRPTDEPLREIGVEVGSFDHKQLTADFSDRLSEDGRWRYRLTGLVQEADTHVDYVNNDRVYIAPALTWAPTENTTLTFLTHYQKNETRYPWSAFPREGTDYPSEHGTIPDHRYIGEPSFDGYDSEEVAFGYLLEHHFGERWTFRQNFRYRDITYDVLDHFRDYSAANPIRPDGRTLERGVRARYDDGATLTLDNNLSSDWQWGGAEHTVLVGLDYKDLDYDSRNSGFDYGASPIDLYDPEYGNVIEPTAFTRTETEARQVGLYLQDHIKWNERWVTTLGARQDWVKEKTTGNASRDQDELSLRAGVVYLADGGWAPYASYSESFTPNYGINDVTGEQYDPITGKQYEVGVRWQPPAWGLSASAAIFEITRENELVTDPDNPLNSIQAGETRSRGVELGLTADLTRNLQAVASYTYQDVEVVEAGGDQLTNGNQVGDAPEHLAKLWLDYTLSGGPLAGLGLGGGVRYTGSSYTNANNTYKYPSATLVDAAIRYQWDAVRLQLTATNLFDEQKVYCSGAEATAFCDYGLPRSVIGSMTYNW